MGKPTPEVYEDWLREEEQLREDIKQLKAAVNQLQIGIREIYSRLELALEELSILRTKVEKIERRDNA